MTLNNRTLTMITAMGLGLALGWGLAVQGIKAQDAKKKEWKGANGGKEEFDLYDAFQKAKGKAKVETLDKWKQAFPQSDFAEDREDAYLGTYQELNMVREAFNKGVEILRARPNHFYSIYAIETLIYQLSPVQPADLDTGERVSRHVLDDLDAIFAPANKPQQVNDQQWTQTKGVMRPLAQRCVAWVFVQRKDNAKAEVELTKLLQMDASLGQFSYFLAQAMFNQRQQSPEKQPSAIFHFARAATLEGPNAMTAANRKTALDYVTNLYNTYHGSNEGFAAVLAAAKAAPFPPAGFTIKSGADIAREKAEEQAKLDAANPIFAFWRDLIREPLLKDDGQMYFDTVMKGALLPGDPGKQKGFDKFKARLISMSPANRPKELVLGLQKPDVADVTLKFEDPLPGNMEPGADLEFEGVPASFVKEPFMITFDVTPEQLTGWTGKNAPGTKQKAAPKGGAKGATKGKAK